MSNIMFLIGSFLICCQLLYLCNGQCPNGVYEYGVNTEEQNQILELHNNYRLELAHGEVEGQPRATNMKRITWDEYLAGQAQNIANECVFRHSRVQDSRFQVGQNIAISNFNEYTKGSNWTYAISAWWDEHTNYNYPDDAGEHTGHYTQVAWADTDLIGCGYTQYPTSDGASKLYVCNYGPAGNWPGQAPYETGDSGCENLC